jgi:hypothetical protein
MKATDVLARGQTSALKMLEATVADFSDEEMLARPCSGANHPLWQVGHLCVAETAVMNAIKPGSMPELPAGFADRFANKKTNHIDDPKLLAPKKEVVELLGKVVQAVSAATKTFSDADLEKPAPERFQKFFPTVGDVLQMEASHIMMHVGQIQAARRKLGKPILM